MKSIVLCENSVVEKNKSTNEVAEINQEDSEKVTKKLTNGNADDKTSTDTIQVIEIDSKSVCNGNSIELDPSTKENSTEENGDLRNLGTENLENGDNARVSADCKATHSHNSTYDDVDTLDGTLASKVSVKNKSNFNETQERLSETSECSGTIVYFEKSVRNQTLSNKSMVLESENCTKGDEPSENERLNKPIVIGNVVSVKEVSQDEKEEHSQPINTESVQNTGNIEKESSTCVNVSKKLSFVMEDSMVDIDLKRKSEEKKEIEQPMAAILLDVDENKENEKDNKIDESRSRNDYMMSNESRFEIQVGECQTIFDSEKNSLWEEKTEADPEENSFFVEENRGENLKNESLSNGPQTSDTNEMECLIVENEVNNVDKDKKEENEIEEIDPSNDTSKSNTKENVKMDLDDSSSNVCARENKTETNKANCINLRKRQRSQEEDSKEPTAKKKKKMSDDNEIISVKDDESSDNSSLGKNSINESLCKELSTSKTELTSNKGATEKNSKKTKTSTVCDTERRRTRSTEKIALTSSFWTSLRGTLKNMTRSDLEELIVQKFCEVITERSTVGELRRKAQALEQDQEKWKGKVQSLTKLLREMEMVMKKYMSEVQKQTKEGDHRLVTPLRVTRSVGLQVSFYSSASRGPKPISPQIVTPNPVQNVNGRNKQSPSKLPSPINVYPKNTWNKQGNQKNSVTPQKSPNVRQKKSAPPRNEFSVQQNRPQVPQPVNRSPLAQNQSPGNLKVYSNKAASVAQPPPPPPPPPPQQQQHQQQQQNTSSKVIDLTEDDDRQPNVAKSPGSIRVLNYLTSPQLPTNKKFTYILPAGTASPPTTIAGGQSRQVLIAAPAPPQTANRPLMCSMPPLLFKGGNVVQQPPPQPPMLNQSNRVILPKTLRHPAPLPQPPANQSNRPNLKLLPPRPALKISKVQTGIVLSWNMSLSPDHAPISSYQLYAYQEGNSPPATSLWKKVGDVKALPLPMACTLTQFMSGHKYHFAVRAVDLHSRIGPFSFPGTIVLVK